tara:strand:- start:4409 stop:5041 length:633 start_codon:yes stop_codon:yes gene_type:complete
LKRGTFITFEGGEGAGKTTQISALQKKLDQSSIRVIITREPGGSKGAELIRELLVSGSVDKWDPFNEAILHFAARRDHINNTIEPALKSGIWVLCDRFTDSTFAYQGFGQGISLDDITALKKLSIGDFQPDLTFLLELPAEIGLERARARDDLQSRYEKMDLKTHKKIGEGFHSIANDNNERIKIIDASESITSISSKIWVEVSSRYNIK